MVWEEEVTDQFTQWWSTLSDDQREAVTERVDILAERGPDLGRPIVDRIHSSRHQSMKELRAAKGGELRVLFSFDPRRQAILLLGGDKSGASPALGRPSGSRRCGSTRSKRSGSTNFVTAKQSARPNSQVASM